MPNEKDNKNSKRNLCKNHNDNRNFVIRKVLDESNQWNLNSEIDLEM